MSSTINKTFQYFETHGGSGELLFEDGKEENGTALIAGQHKNEFKCVIMELDSKNITKLRQLMPFKEYPHVTILQGDSNKEIQKILSNIERYFFSLGFIDPDSPNQLKWSTIETIANYSYIRKRDGFLRRPEMLITFPIKRINQNAGTNIDKMKENDICRRNVEFNNEFFGDNGRWIEIYNEYENDPLGKREALVDYYATRLGEFYKYVMPLILVESIDRNPLYYIVSCTQHYQGDDFFHKVKTDIERWKKEDWVRNYFKVHSLFEYNESKTKSPSIFDFVEE